MGATAEVDARHYQQPRNSYRNQGKKEEAEATYQRSFDISSIATTPRGIRAPDHIGKAINSDTPIEIERDHPKDVIQKSSQAEYGEFGEQSSEKCIEIRVNRSILEAFAEATEERNFGRVELLLTTTEIGRNADILERTLEDVARQGNEKIVESMLNLTKSGDNKQFMRRIFLEVAREERDNIVALLLGFTKIGQHSRFIGFIEPAEKGNEK